MILNELHCRTLAFVQKSVKSIQKKRVLSTLDSLNKRKQIKKINPDTNLRLQRDKISYFHVYKGIIANMKTFDIPKETLIFWNARQNLRRGICSSIEGIVFHIIWCINIMPLNKKLCIVTFLPYWNDNVFFFN